MATAVELTQKEYPAHDALRRAFKALVLVDPDTFYEKVIVGSDDPNVAFSKFARFMNLDAFTTVNPFPQPAAASHQPQQQIVVINQSEALDGSDIGDEDDDTPSTNSLPLCIKARSSVDIEAQLASQNKFKTELCRFHIETGKCHFGERCHFAHGKDELRHVMRHPNYKTRICKNYYQNGTCQYGVRCRFIHKLGAQGAGSALDADNMTGDHNAPGDNDEEDNCLQDWPVHYI